MRQSPEGVRSPTTLAVSRSTSKFFDWPHKVGRAKGAGGSRAPGRWAQAVAWGGLGLTAAAGLLALWSRHGLAQLPTALGAGLWRGQLPANGSHVGCQTQAGLPPCRPDIVPDLPLQAELAVCLIIRDDQDFPEWLTYHRRIGVGAFYIFDHGSSIALPDRMPDDALLRGDVHYSYVNQFPQASDTCPQMAVYHECLRRGRHHPWMAFIDVDEYLVPAAGGVYLPDFLRAYVGNCALAVNWQLFGTGPHVQRPQGGVLENYTKCVPRDNILNWWTKVIVNPQFVVDFNTIGTSGIQGPHTVHCRRRTYTVDESGARLGTPNAGSLPMDKLVVHHYVTRSLTDYSARMRKGASSGEVRNLAYFTAVNRQATEDCLGARDLSRALGSMQAAVG